MNYDRTVTGFSISASRETNGVLTFNNLIIFRRCGSCEDNMIGYLDLSALLEGPLLLNF